MDSLKMKLVLFWKYFEKGLHDQNFMFGVSIPLSKIAEKSILWECIFDNMVLYFDC